MLRTDRKILFFITKPLCFYTSRKLNVQENTRIHSTQPSPILTKVLEAAFGAWHEGMYIQRS